MPGIGPKEAIAKAKAFVAALFSEELKSEPTLEEIWSDDNEDAWIVTIGVRRASNYVERSLTDAVSGKPGRIVPDYKSVRVSRKTGEVVSVLNRDLVQP